MAKKGTRDPRQRIGRGGQFVAPPPRGIRLNPAALPKSTQYVPPEPDPDEEAAFTDVVDSGRPERTTRKGRPLPGEALTPAAMRMRGRQLPPDDADDEDEDNGEVEQGNEHEFDDDVDAPPTPPAVPKPNGRTTAAAHPISPFTTVQTAPAPAPPGLPAGIVLSNIEGLFARAITPEDTDRLWDWVRADKDYGQAFLGRQIRSSLALHTFMQRLVEVEAQGIALIRSIQFHEHHLGFAMLAPILAEEKTALMHVYLQPAVRGQLAQFVVPLVDIARKVAPGVHLAVVSADESWARLHRQVLKPLGFREHVMFVL